MSTRWPSVLITLLGCLLAFATSASAECAWVMWTETLKSNGTYVWELNPPGQVAIDIVFKTRETCELQLKVRYEYINIGPRPPGVEKYHLFCLPDTVDPRGPKGK